MKAASPVLNGGDEETGFVRPRLVATQLECEHPTSYNEDRKWSLMNLSHLTEVFETALVHIKIGVTMEVSESAARFSRQKLRIMALCRKRSCTWPLRINTPASPRHGITGGPLLHATVVSPLRSVLVHFLKTCCARAFSWERGHLGRFLSRRDACAPRLIHKNSYGNALAGVYGALRCKTS